MLGERDVKKARSLISFTWPGESLMVSFERSHSNLLHFNMKVDSCIQRRIPAPIAAVDWMDPAPSERIPSFISSRLIVRLISIPHISSERTTAAFICHYLSSSVRLEIRLRCYYSVGCIYIFIFGPAYNSLDIYFQATAFSVNSSCLCSLARRPNSVARSVHFNGRLDEGLEMRLGIDQPVMMSLVHSPQKHRTGAMRENSPKASTYCLRSMCVWQCRVRLEMNHSRTVLWFDFCCLERVFSHQIHHCFLEFVLA